MTILCIGQAAYDITFPIHEPIVENQKYRVMNKIECMGAPAANAAYLCALWGGKTTLQAKVGNDIYGHKILDTLKQVDVDVSCMHVDDTFETSISGIITNQESGHRTIFNCPGTISPVTFPNPQGPVSIILVDGHEKDASLAALKRYPEAISIIDAGTLREDTRELSKHVDYLICSQDFAYQYTNIYVSKNNTEDWTKVFEKLHTLNPHHIAVTMGHEGLLYEDEQGIHHMDAFLVKAVDTCGAGDIFHGAFAYCISKSYSFVDSLCIASMTSAISVESYGSQISIPNKEIVNKRLEKALASVTLI